MIKVFLSTFTFKLVLGTAALLAIVFGANHLVRMNEEAADKAVAEEPRQMAMAERDLWVCWPLRGDRYVVCEVPPYSLRVQAFVSIHKGGSDGSIR